MVVVHGFDCTCFLYFTIIKRPQQQLKHWLIPFPEFVEFRDQGLRRRLPRDVRQSAFAESLQTLASVDAQNDGLERTTSTWSGDSGCHSGSVSEFCFGPLSEF